MRAVEKDKFNVDYVFIWDIRRCQVPYTGHSNWWAEKPASSMFVARLLCHPRCRSRCYRWPSRPSAWSAAWMVQ